MLCGIQHYSERERERGARDVDDDGGVVTDGARLGAGQLTYGIGRSRSSKRSIKCELSVLPYYFYAWDGVCIINPEAGQLTNGIGRLLPHSSQCSVIRSHFTAQSSAVVYSY
jgi:hypothetical protein